MSSFYIYTIFKGPSGWYYCPVGDEIFFARRLYCVQHGPVYELDFGDEKIIGLVSDHGFNVFLGAK